MVISVLLVFFNLFVIIFNIILIARIVYSWIVPDLHSNWTGRLLVSLTEPLLAPVRKLLPKGGLIDWAPMITIFALYALRALVSNLLFH